MRTDFASARKGIGPYYRATPAQARAQARAARPKIAKLKSNERLRTEVEERLGKKDSPVQIAGRLRRDFPSDPEMWVAHETIYQSVYIESRGGLKRELARNLRMGLTLRKPQRRPDERRGRIEDMVRIADRPAAVQDRAVPGNWEGDLIVGKDGKSAIAALVAAKPILVMLAPTLPTSLIALCLTRIANALFFAATLAARSEYAPIEASGQVFIWVGALKIAAG